MNDRRHGYSWLVCGCLVLLAAPCPRAEDAPSPPPAPHSVAWHDALRDPPREYTLIPFWFWNDTLSEDAIRRQIDEFVAHGVYGFLIHPRIGLPRDTGFMSDRYLHFVKVAVEHAARRGLIVHLYDEGMYPSGSACGQVVRDDPRFAARCLVSREVAAGQEVEPGEDEHLVTVQDLPGSAGGRRIAVFDAPSGGKIRGVHFGQDDGDPGQPPAADLLNQEAVDSFIRHVHERYYSVLREHFGKTVQAMFTDEPSMLGRRHRRGAQPWTTGLETHLKRLLGYDVRPHLPKLWHDVGGSEAKFREEFHRAVLARLEETYYARLSRWCADHGIALTGHPAQPDDIGVLRHFQLPGQDVVWRYLEPGKPSALEGSQSTMGKCSSSAAVHLGRSRNGNEAFGAYGWNLTYDEMRWVTDWLLVRGVNLIWPHAFYYSIRGKRRDERPPDVGPNNTWWPRYREYADYVRRASWLNAAGLHHAEIAILGRPNHLPFRAAKALFQSQRDFNYLEDRKLATHAEISEDGIRIGPMTYRVLIIDDDRCLDSVSAAKLQPFVAKGRLLLHGAALGCTIEGARAAQDRGRLLAAIATLVPADLEIEPPHPDLRYRHVVHGSRHVYFLFNEGESTIRGTVSVAARGARRFKGRLETGLLEVMDGPCVVDLGPHSTVVVVVEE